MVNRLKLILTLIFIIKLGNSCVSQNETNELINDSIANAFRVKKNKIFIIGEFSNQSSNKFINYSILTALNKSGIYPRYLISDFGNAKAFLINNYLITGLECDLDNVSPIKSDRSFFLSLHKYRTTLPDSLKFYAKGVTFDNTITYTYLALYELLKKIDFKKMNNLKYNFPKEVISDFLKTDELAATNNQMKRFVEDFYKDYLMDSTSFKNILDYDYSAFKDIIFSYEKYLILNKNNKKQRNEIEELTAENIYKIIKEDSTAVLFGQFGNYHIPLTFQKKWTYNSINSFVSILNTNAKYNLTNNSIHSSTIIYDYLPYNWYKFLFPEKNLFNMIKSSNSTNEIKLIPYPNNTGINSLILYNSKLQPINASFER